MKIFVPRFFALFGLLACFLLGPDAARAQVPPPVPTPAIDAGWPRKIAADGLVVTVYQPQLEKWDGHRLQLRAAVAVQTQAAAQPTFGVLWATARTQTDKENRLVYLDDVRITKANFPAAPGQTDEYRKILATAIPPGTRTIALARLEADLTIAQAEDQPVKSPLKNEPPRIIVSSKPALLVLIDGKPALRQVEGTKLLRVINTRSLILLDQTGGKYYLRLMDRWMTANQLDGSWALANNPPATLATALRAATGNPQVDLLDHLADDIAAEVENGVLPVVYVSTVPAELIETHGQLNFAPIDGTQLLWVKNTESSLLLDTASQNYYVLLSGRWFRAKALEGPWEFVAADKLPADFAKVPLTHPRGDVLSSVAGTPQAREASIANRVPQTAAINRKQAKLSVFYDGPPQFQPIADTQLRSAVNSPTPVIQTGPQAYYAVENGVWFAAASPVGPWTVATTVPASIYAMPPSSPLYYVTGVQIYDATPEVVYMGYTPAYFGTVVAPAGVVVYGTGWNYAPWIGNYWYGRPWSYGYGVRFGYTPSGWGFGYSTAVGRPWWGPAGWQGAGGDWRRGWETGYGGRYAGSHMNNVNFGNFNCYHRWGNNVQVNHPVNTTVNANKQTNITNQQRGFNNVMATRDGNVVRKNADGWEKHTAAGGWKSYKPDDFPKEKRPAVQNDLHQMNQQWSARQHGTANYHDYRSASGDFTHHPTPERSFSPGRGGYGGFHGNPGGYRGGRRR